MNHPKPGRLTVLSCALLLSIFGSGCGENFLHHYNCRGTVIDAAGKPVAGAKIHIDRQGDDPAVYGDGKGLYYCWDDPDFFAATDAQGRFSIACSGEEYAEYFFLPSPAPPLLNKVWAWFRRGDGWVVTPVELTPAEQQRMTGSGGYANRKFRSIDLPPITIPPPNAPIVRSSVGPVTAPGVGPDLHPPR